MTDIQILPIAPEHIDGFHACLDVVARERSYLVLLEAPPLKAVRVFVRQNIANDWPQFVALHRQSVIGWCDILPDTKEGFTHSGRLGMGLHRDFRGRGIGQRLVARTLEKARAKGLERIQLDVYASNRAAMRLYEKMGFVVEGVQKRARKLDGVYDDVILMALLLDGTA